MQPLQAENASLANESSGAVTDTNVSATSSYWIGLLACERVPVTAFGNDIMDPETVKVTKEVVSAVVGVIVATSGDKLHICSRQLVLSVCHSLRFLDPDGFPKS